MKPYLTAVTGVLYPVLAIREKEFLASKKLIDIRTIVWKGHSMYIYRIHLLEALWNGNTVPPA